MTANKYESRPVDIPSTFLTGQPSEPITYRDVSFATSDLPEYDGCTAFVLENVLSPDECKQLLDLAEDSVPRTAADEQSGKFSPWVPAMVAAPGGEVLLPNYRNSDRIIWDEPVITDRLWQRCAQGPAVQEAIGRVNDMSRRRNGKWVFREPNKRMRFLKYTEGQFFKSHVDSPFGYDKDGREFQTHFTLHLYLNDSAAVTGSPDDLVGGSTAFMSRNRDKRLEVDPRAGSVLIFQHSRLVHEGAVVKKGTKYTMRTDLLFEWIPEENAETNRGTNQKRG